MRNHLTAFEGLPEALRPIQVRRNSHAHVDLRSGASTKFLTSKNSYTNMVAAYNLHAGEFQTKHDMDCKDVSLALVASMENRDEILDAYIAISQELLARWRLKGLTENLYKEVKTLKADAAKLLEQQGAAAIEAEGDDMD